MSESVAKNNQKENKKREENKKKAMVTSVTKPILTFNRDMIRPGFSTINRDL